MVSVLSSVESLPGSVFHDFPVAGAAGAVGALANHFLPEIFGDVTIAAIASEFVVTRRRDHLRDVRVDVQALEFVAVAAKRIEELPLVEALREVEVVLLAGDRVEIAERLRPCLRIRCRARAACVRS